MHPRRAVRFSTMVVTLLAWHMLTAVPAAADSVGCQREIVKRSAKFFEARLKASQKCADKHLKGQVASCPDAKTAAKIAKQESKLRASIDKGCGGADKSCGTGGDDESLASIGWNGGSCPNFEHGSCNGTIGNCDQVGDCLACIDRAAVDQAIDLSYGAFTGTSDNDVLECQRAIGKETAKFLSAKSKALRKCEDMVVTGQSSGPCPDAMANQRITQAHDKLSDKICKACGGDDHACGTADDLSLGTIGFASSCPDVTVPGGPSCGGSITTLAQAVACLQCVAQFKGACADSVAAASVKSYPSECNAAIGPTPMPTPNNCGDGHVDPGETCDGGDDGACPGGCRPNCTCPGPCVLPAAIPEVVSFVVRPGTDLDTGWTGISHDVPGIDNAATTAGRLSNCDLDTGSPTCGQCDLDGPVSFPGAGKNCVCFNVGDPDASSLTACDPEASTCSSPDTCECFFGAPLPISAGAVPVCVVNRYLGAVTGTANIADGGPHAGEGTVSVHLRSAVHTGIAVDRPCPTCEGDGTPRDGVKSGHCNGGAENGRPCDVGGNNAFFGDLSLDCLPKNEGNIGNLKITFNPATTGTTTLGSGPTCTAPGFTSRHCFCDTCTTPAAEPCNHDADCPATATCGGKRCINSTNAGQTCTVPSECPGGFCGRIGNATAPNQCQDTTCSPNASDAPNEGVCAAGPFDLICSKETFRGCQSNADCTPKPSGNCDGCEPGQICTSKTRECFLDPIVRVGLADPQNPVVAATFCIPPTTSASVNSVSGLPGPGAIRLPLRVFRSGAQCGNGVINGGEDCDPPNDAACHGACQADCSCPTCGDGKVNRASEECDGGDDDACPGSCQSDCTCATGTCGNGVLEFGEECDGTATDDACPGACQPGCTCGPFCGDGLVNGSEECDGAASTACPPAACSNCTCGPYCGDGVVNGNEECDGTGVGVCPGTCEGNCTCSPVCGDNMRQAGELCDGTDDAVCPGHCTDICTCPSVGHLTLVVKPGADLDTGWTGTAHDSAIQAGSTIAGELSNCDGQSDVVCDFFGNVGSFCSTDPSRSCTADSECNGAGTCIINTYGPPLPLSAGGVPACIVNRFATDVTGTFNIATGDSELFVELNSLVHLGSAVSQPCPICDCGKANVQDCQIGESGTCTGILGSPPCIVEGTGTFGPTSNDCPPSSSLNVSGGGLKIPFAPVTTGTTTFASNQPCDGAGYTNQSCWCDAQPQPSQCLTACDGGSHDAQSCNTDADCPGAPAGACKPLCRQIAGENIGEGQCVAGPVVQTCAGAHEIGCVNSSDCPSGKGPCVANNQRCFMDPIVRVGMPGTTTNVGAATFCIPATTGQAINQTAGLPGPGAITFPNAVTIALCGDDEVNQAREECDGTDDGNCPGTCQPNCTCQRTCGNGSAEFGEQCDPGGPGGSPAPDDAACPGSCVAAGADNECTCPPICGDGFVGPNEQCDPGGVGGNPPPSDAACPGLCTAGSCQCPLPPLPACGNNMLDPGEACDLPAIGCGPLQACLVCNQCFPPPDIVPPETGFICGNLNIEPTESCELPAINCADGEICNPTTCDECIPLLPVPVCGNLNIESGETCELPSIGCGAGETCLACQQCIPTLPICGNLNLEPGEACELPARGCGPLQVCLLCQQCVP